MEGCSHSQGTLQAPPAGRGREGPPELLWEWAPADRKKGPRLQCWPPPTSPITSCSSFPRGERIICFSCCPDLWAALFFIYLHKRSKVTRSFPEVRDSVNTSGSQVSRPAWGGRGYRRSPGTSPVDANFAQALWLHMGSFLGR